MENTDAQARIDAFQDEAWEKLSVRAKSILIAVDCDEPAKLKTFVESDFNVGKRRLINFGKKTKEELRAFCDYFEKNHPAEAYPKMSEREMLAYTIRRNAPYFTNEEVEFILSYSERIGHYPMFYMLAKSFEHSDNKKFQIIREYIGLCGERKTEEQLMEMFHLAKSTIRDELYSVDHAIRETIIRLDEVVANDWGQYEIADEVLQKPLLSNEDFLPLYQSVKDAENLSMDLECFVEVCYYALGFFGRVEQRGRRWLYTVDGVQRFRFDWLLQDFRKIRWKKNSEPFDLSEACQNTEYWSDEKVIRKAVPTVIEITKQMIWHLYQLSAKGNKIILNNRRV